MYHSAFRALKFDTNYAELKVGLGSSMTEEVNEDYKYTVYKRPMNFFKL